MLQSVKEKKKTGTSDDDSDEEGDDTRMRALRGKASIKDVGMILQPSGPTIQDIGIERGLTKKATV